MIPYQTKSHLLAGTSSEELNKQVRYIYRKILAKSKRKPYVRSAYFKKDKIFFDYFWIHLNKKGRKLKTKRLRYFSAAVDLIQNCRNHPISKENPNEHDELLHRFYGLTVEKFLFCVQIKEEKRSGAKYFMSVFPPG